MKKLFFAVALALSGGLLTAELGELPADWAAAKNWLVPWTDGKRVVIRDFKGNDLLELTQICLAHPCIDESKDDYWAYDTKIKFAEQLGANIVRVEYENTRPEDFKEHYALVVSEGGPRLRIENRVVVRKGGRRIGTASGRSVQFSTMYLHPVPPCALPKGFVRGGIWTKPEQGESYEAGGAALIPYVVPEGGLFLWCDTVGRNRDHMYDDSFCLQYRPANLAEALRDKALTVENAKGVIMPATGEYYAQLHGKKFEAVVDAAPMSEPAKEDLAYSNIVNLYYLPWKDAAFVATAMQMGEPLAATVKTGKDFNLFDSSRERAAFDVTMMNPKGEQSGEVKCRVIARNYDGKADLDESFTVSLKPYEITSRRFTLPKRTRDYWFVNAEFNDGKASFFVRADVAALEPFKYKSPNTSIMGIAAPFDIPSVAVCDRLVTRMGARWIRTSGGGEIAKYLSRNDRRGILSFHLDDRATNEVQRIAFAKEKLKEAAAYDCPIVEIGNELNFGAWGEEADQRSSHYCVWLRAFYDARAELKLENKVKISTFGFAGCTDGCAFYRAMEKAGCWEYCDILSLHPGRLNQTPDRVVDDFQWNYLAQIRSTKQFMRQLREKKNKKLALILTEVYARTPPNKEDSDSTRTAAENVVLSCALAKIEGVTALNWYQLHDSVHSDIGAINEYNTEYHYGLLRRDGTVKPSALAFCTISEALDGAEFVREVNFEDDRKAWEFTTPHGKMCVIYDRKDGYYPYGGMFTDRPFTGHLEPWIDHWKSHTDYRFEAPRGFVVIRDAIGRTRKVKADAKGYVTLTLSGAPLIVYGLGAPAPAAVARSAPDLGLTMAEGATPEEIAAFRSLGGTFACDANLGDGFARCEYFPLPETTCSEADAAAQMKDLYAKGVRRMLVPIAVPKGDGAKALGEAYAARLKPWAAARKANRVATPEIWVLPSGDRWSAMLGGVKEFADGIAFLWESYPWAEPYAKLGEFTFEAKAFGLPYILLNFGPVGSKITWQDNGRERAIADAQFFGAFLIASLQPNCRAIALTNLKDAESGSKALGTSGLAATIKDFVDSYNVSSGLFDRSGKEKTHLKAARFVRELTRNASAPEYAVTPGGLRIIRFWDGARRCAAIWQGNRNCLTQERVDDLTGEPEAGEVVVTVRGVKKTPEVYDVYGERMDVPVKNGRAAVRVGLVPIVVRGIDDAFCSKNKTHSKR